MPPFSKPVYLYCVQCVTPKHLYVGTTDRPWGVRLQEHKSGNYCDWTRKHGYKRCLWYRRIDPAKQFRLENEFTVALMRQRGWRYVRGGDFVNAQDIDSEYFDPFWLPIEFGGSRFIDY